MSGDWLRDLGTRFGWTAADLFRTARAACKGLPPADADDVLQEAARALGTLFKSGVPPAITTTEELNKYVFVAVRNQKWKFLERRAREQKRVAHVDPEDISGGTKMTRDRLLKVRPGSPADLTDDEKERVLALLPADGRRLRDHLRLHLDGLTGQDIARSLGTSGATVSRRLDDCLAVLSRKMLGTDPEGDSADGHT